MFRILAALTGAFLLVSVAAGPADASTVSIRSGDLFTVTTAPFYNRCTITDVGYWNGQRVALTAGHCGLTGLRAIKNGKQFGTFHRDPAGDYAFIVLDKHVRWSTSGRHVSSPSAWMLGCKNGNGYLNSQITCGLIYQVSPTKLCTTVMLTPGDSGSPLYSGNRLLGIASSVFDNGCAMSFTNIRSVQGFEVA